MVNDQGGVVVVELLCLKARGKARRSASLPKLSSGLSQAHVMRVCAQLDKELVGATHRPISAGVDPSTKCRGGNGSS